MLCLVVTLFKVFIVLMLSCKLAVCNSMSITVLELECRRKKSSTSCSVTCQLMDGERRGQLLIVVWLGSVLWRTCTFCTSEHSCALCGCVCISIIYIQAVLVYFLDAKRDLFSDRVRGKNIECYILFVIFFAKIDNTPLSPY